ncbi:MAG: AAA family ATPase [Candidatus Tectimicrobiota bacterium]
MIPLSLRLRNFMSYGEDVPALDFSGFTTACLTGDNGHGKSTLLDAITWALWGEARAKNLDDVVRLGQEDAEVEFTFELESERYRVLRKRSVRTRQSALELQGFDKAAARYRSLSGNSIRETEAKIVQLLHMNYDTFINSVFVLQGRADEFTTRRPGERKRILGDILGLSIYDLLEARAKTHRGEMDQEVRTLSQRLSELQQEVAQKDHLAQMLETHRTALEHIHVELHTAQEGLEQLRQRQNVLTLQSQRANDVARRLQQLRHELLDIEQQRTTHQRRVSEYETILQQESVILAGYQHLQQLREQERLYQARSEEYTSLHQRQTALQQSIHSAQYRYELEQRTARQRLQELEHKLQQSEALLQTGAAIRQAYHDFQEARRQEAQFAQALQQRHVLEQEKSQVEFRIQQKRHGLELEQRSLLDRQRDWQLKEATLPSWQQQVADCQQQLLFMEQQGKRLEQIRLDGMAVKVQLESSIPQAQEAMHKEIHEHEEKRLVLETAGAHCPLCEKALSDQERRRVIQKLVQEMRRREARIQELQAEHQQLVRQRQALRVEYKQVEQDVSKRQTIEQQYAAAQASLAEAIRARENLATVLQGLQELEARLMAGTYAAEELTRLQALNTQLEALPYERQAHAALQQSLRALADAEVQQARLQQAEEEVLALRGQRHEMEQQLAGLEQTLQTAQFALAERVELQALIARLEHLDFSPAAHQALRQQIQELQYVERHYVQLETARQHLAEEHTVLQGLEERHQRLRAEVTTFEHEQQQFASELGALQGVQQALSVAEESVRSLREREGTLRVTLGRSQSQYEHCLQQEAELQRKQQQRERAVAERTLYGDLAQMFGKNGIQAIMIENAIPELEDEANRMLSRVTDNAMHLTLETQRDTRTGGVAETLDIKISDALGTRSYELFSGGEAFRINFAVRVALAKMLARRAGARLRTLVIDEGFGTQDTEGLERLVEVIKAIQGDFAKIIVITHLRELKNAFETHIEVKKDPLRGSFYQIL